MNNPSISAQYEVTTRKPLLVSSLPIGRLQPSEEILEMVADYNVKVEKVNDAVAVITTRIVEIDELTSNYRSEIFTLSTAISESGDVREMASMAKEVKSLESEVEQLDGIRLVLCGQLQAQGNNYPSNANIWRACKNFAFEVFLQTAREYNDMAEDLRNQEDMMNEMLSDFRREGFVFTEYQTISSRKPPVLCKSPSEMKVVLASNLPSNIAGDYVL